METDQPAKILKAQLPPAEPPPSLEKQHEEMQWLQDTTEMATKILQKEVIAKVAMISPTTYNKNHNIAPEKKEQQEFRLQQIIYQNKSMREQRTVYQTKHPQVHYLSIPTPKQANNYYTLDNSFTNSNWQDNETTNWIKSTEDTWQSPDSENNSNIHTASQHGTETLAEKWDNMISNHNPKKIGLIKHKIKIRTENIQNDTGANKAVTNNRDILYNYKTIQPYPIGGVKADNVAITCTGQGYLPWSTREGNVLMIKTMYCEEVDGTIISPTTVVEQYNNLFQGFTIEANCDDGTGQLKFLNRDGVNHNTIAMHMDNGLWFHHYQHTEKNNPRIKRLNDACFSNLWHGRLAHVGNNVTHNIHHHVKGIDRPIKQNMFHKCGSCLPNKMSKHPHEHNNKHHTKMIMIKLPDDSPDNTSDAIKGVAGQNFHMDFGFVRGSKYRIKQENHPTVTSIDGYNSYLLIVDKKTRYLWLFLTTSKSLPITIAQKVLQKFRCTNPHRTVRTDQGKELGKSKAFQDMVVKEGFTLELTGADASAQNAIAESPNKYLANMMRCLLHAENLGPEYWSFALTHAVFIKNRIPHSSINMTPYEAITGKQPDLSNLRTFGCRIFVKKPGKRPDKLDYHTSNGIFMGYTASMKNMYYIDDMTNQIKIGVHAYFDEAHFTVPKEQAPLAAQNLQTLGYRKPKDIFSEGKYQPKYKVDVTMISKAAIEPSITSPESGIMEIYSSQDKIQIPAGEHHEVPTDIVLTTPSGTYLQVMQPVPTHPMAQLTVTTSLLEHDNKMPLVVKVYNPTNNMLTIHQGTCIAHVTQHKRQQYNMTITPENKQYISTKQRGQINHPVRQNNTCTPTPDLSIDTITNTPQTKQTHHIPFNDDEIDKGSISYMTTHIETPYQIELSTDPLDNHINIEIATRGNHETLGLDLEQKRIIGNRIQLKNCQ